MEKKNLYFYISPLVCIAITFIFSFSNVWQFIIIPGIITGIFNKTMKRGALSGALGVGTFWLIYMIHGIITKNSYLLLDQIGTLFIGTGYGWVLFLIIILMGISYGALGGAIGGSVTSLVKPRLKKYLERLITIEETSNVD